MGNISSDPNKLSSVDFVYEDVAWMGWALSRGLLQVLQSLKIQVVLKKKNISPEINPPYSAPP